MNAEDADPIADRTGRGDEPEPLRYTGHLIRRAQQRHVALWIRDVSGEVSSVQFAALAVLDRSPGMSQRELGESLDLDRSTIADVVARMARRGVLTRTEDPADRRRNNLELTKTGRDELASLRPRVQELEHTLMGVASSAERGELRRILKIVIAGDGHDQTG